MKLPEELLFSRKKRLPVFRGAEAAECGLACVAMIGSYHGHDIDLNGLRQKFAISMSGASLRGLMGIADELGLASRALRVDLSALNRVRLPAILHWNLNHFVVLKEISRTKAIIHDPSRGRMVFTIDELSKRFTGVVLELTPTAQFSVIEAKVPVRLSSLWTKIHGVTSSAVFVLAMSASLQAISLLLPFQLQLVMDQAIGQNDLDLLAIIAVGFSCLMLLQVVLSTLRDWTLQLLSSQIVFQLVGNIFHHLIRLPNSFFEKRHMGDILSRIGATRNIQDLMTQGLLSALIDGSMAMITAVILFLYSPVLAFIILASVILLIFVTLTFYPIIRARTEEQIGAAANEQTHLMESVRAAITIKTMGREAERESVWRNLYSRSFNSSVSLTRLQLTMSSISSIILGAQYILIVYLGARMILTGQGFSIGMLTAFLAFRSTFTDRAQSLVQRGLQFGMVKLYLHRLGDIIAQEVEAQPGALISTEISGEIVLDKVSFRYGSTDRWIFKDLDLTIKAGEYVAIVGATGGGKSTLLKMLLGLHTPVEGQVYLDGQAARPDLWRAWRARMGVVAQDDRLMSGSLSDNITFFDPEMTVERVHAAAIQAQIHGDITNMPMNYQTLVGDMGSALSGGQKQRVLLARALYRNPSILVLDEGTANLDSATEEAIGDLIEQLELTRIVVSHRPALVRRAARVLRLANGKLEDITPVRHEYQVA